MLYHYACDACGKTSPETMLHNEALPLWDKENPEPVDLPDVAKLKRSIASLEDEIEELEDELSQRNRELSKLEQKLKNLKRAI